MLGKRTRRAVLVLASAGAALALGEFAARWRIEGSFAEALDSFRATPTLADDKVLVLDDDLGFKLSPSLAGVNSLGIRHRELETPKPPGECRVLLLGDSVGFPLDGFFRDVELAFAKRAGTDRRFEFINGCVHGYTTHQERVFFERDLSRLEPDLVILQYCVNDNYRFLHRITSKGRRLMTLEAKNYLFPSDSGLGPWLTQKSYLVYSLRKMRFDARASKERAWEGMGRAAWDEATWAPAEDEIRRMAERARAIGAQLMVLAVPHEDQLEARELAMQRDFVLKPQLRLASICESLELPYLDAWAVLSAHADEELYLDRLHLSEHGHRLVGTSLARFVQELLP